MRSINEIQNSPDFLVLSKLKNKDNYFAHLREDSLESLEEHTNLVFKYLTRLVKENDLEGIIDRIISRAVLANFSDSSEEILNFVKTFFINAVYFHDFGKINPNFQREKMNNQVFSHINIGIGSDHSILSAYLYLAYSYQCIYSSKLPENQKSFLYTIVTALSHSIIKHHGILSKAFDYEIKDQLIEKIEDFYNVFESISFIKKDYLKNLLKQNEVYFNYIRSLNENFSIFLLLKLNSSLLTAADYLATNEFMLSIPINDFGVLNDELKTKITSNIETVSYNEKMLNNFDIYKNLSFDDLQVVSHQNLNKLRQKLSSEVISNYRICTDEKLFYIEAPTGSGKTNLSLLIISEILKVRKDVNKIFYIFPFTSLITQTYNNIKKDLKLTDSEIVQLHSKAPFIIDDKSDEMYGSLHKNYIDSLFVNFPFVLMSHIKFFDVLVSNDKESNYLLHRLANSVIILDEMQSYTPSEWDKINYLIQHYSNALNITFVLMSATLPKISKLIFDHKTENMNNFSYLVSNKQNYFTNPNFKNRVTFRFDYVNNPTFTFSNENLADVVFKHSEEYFHKKNRVFTLVEFITKNSAKDFYNLIKKNNFYSDYKIILINGTILEPRRNDIITYLKSGNIKEPKIIIIATQVIEAGLDIDMDVGFKDMSIIDSEEQFAGRINRNASKQDCEIFLFKSGIARYTYSSDIRFKEQKRIKQNQLFTILDQKDFDSYYDLVFQNINKFNIDDFAVNLSSYISYIKSLNFWEVRNNFELIKGNTISIFAPLEIDKKYFTESEVKFLESFGIEIFGNCISGKYIWEIYSELVTNREKDFIKAKAHLKIISSIMSKYCFSSWINSNFYNLLKHYGEELYGYFYLSNWRDIYSYKDGLKSDLETDCNFI
ncbi:MAG: CRISPR-associated helicase/endonuclease Cas3 [Ignavibacterium sp.]